MNPRLVTFDLFSALIDSRTGASRVLAAIAAERGWAIEGERLYDEWDRRNKAAQLAAATDGSPWVPFADHCRRSLAATYDELGLTGGLPPVDTAMLLGSVAGWPLWPDVAEGLPAIGRRHRVGVLSNVDDEVFARSKVAALVRDDDVLTSERLRAYKPGPDIYRRAAEAAGGALVHVATSARDVRGALEAGIEVIRLRRPGHALDPAGPQPGREAGDLGEVAALLG